MEVQLSSNAGSRVQWILTRHGTSMRKALETWKVSTFFFKKKKLCIKFKITILIYMFLHL